MSKAAVIGTGIGGIAVAIRLALKGYETHIYESNDYPGGKLSEFSFNGFRFDAGPSLLTMPQYVDELFTLAGKDPKDYFRYQKLEEICRYFWLDGTNLKMPADRIQMIQNLSELFGDDANQVEKYLQTSAKNYQILAPLFIEKSLHKLETWVSKEAIKGYLRIPKLGLFETLHQKNESEFQSSKLIQLFDRYATYNGSDPYQTPANMSIIPHLEYNIGAFFPENGMFGITQAIVKLAENCGVKFHYNAKVSQILISDKKVEGIKIRDKVIKYNLVVSNMDITPTYRNLMPEQKAPEKTLRQPRSGSGLIFYWGVNKEFPEFGLHNILFSENYKKEFEHQFIKGNICDDPTIYLNITSKIKKDDAPKGCENWFLLINAPANNGQNWDEMITHTRKNIIEKISRIVKEDISQYIIMENILDPIKIEMKTSSGQGALYGTCSNNRFSAFFRHPNFSRNIKNLYFVGGSVHPGGGIPLALSSAKIVASMV